VRLRSGAKVDLSEIWAFTSKRWSATQADHYLIGLDDMLGLLCEQPEIAQKYGNFTPPVRIYRYRSHLVIFTTEVSVLEVIRVVHRRSNWVEVVSD
jgi:toxin ParE1/3/4